MLAKEAGADDALYGGIDQPAPTPAPAPAPTPAPAPAPAPAPVPAPAPAKAEKAVEKAEPTVTTTAPAPVPAATVAQIPAAIPEGVPPNATENVGIVASKESGGKTFYDIRWTDAAGMVVRVASDSLSWLTAILTARVSTDSMRLVAGIRSLTSCGRSSSSLLDRRSRRWRSLCAPPTVMIVGALGCV